MKRIIALLKKLAASERQDYPRFAQQRAKFVRRLECNKFGTRWNK